MSKKITAFFEDYGMKEVSKNTYYGKLHGFEANGFYRPTDQAFPIRIHLSLYLDNKQPVISKLKNQGFKFFDVCGTEYGILLLFNGLTFNSMKSGFEEKINTIIESLMMFEAKGLGYDPVTGDELTEEAHLYTLDSGFVVLNPATAESLNAKIIEENKEFDSMPNHYFKGFLGALIGSLAGIGLMIILSLIGFISALSGFVAVFCGEKLYRAFKGKPDKIMIVIVSVTSIVMMLIGIVAIDAVIIEGQFLALDASEGIVKDFITALQIPDILSLLIRDILMTLLFTGIGVGVTVAPMLKKTKRQSTLK